MRGQAPEGNGALFLNFVMRGQTLVGKNVERGYKLRRWQIAAFEQHVRRRLRPFLQRLGLLIAVHQNEQRLFSRLVQQDQVERFRGVDQPGNREGALFASGKPVAGVPGSRLALPPIAADLAWPDGSLRMNRRGSVQVRAAPVNDFLRDIGSGEPGLE